MDQAPDRPADAETAAGMSPSQVAWEAYYREASRRRREAGGYRNLRLEKRRRRFRERLGIGISAVIVGAMTLAFYLVLR